MRQCVPHPHTPLAPVNPVYTDTTTPPQASRSSEHAQIGGFLHTNTLQLEDEPLQVNITINQRSMRTTSLSATFNADSDALTHYLDTYTSPITPPSWLVIELLTAGELQRLYAGLARKYRKAIARELHLTEPVLQSWLKSYVRVRNICAHHGRLWNRFLGVYPAIPKSGTVHWLNDGSTFDTGNPGALERKRLYPVLVSLQSILFTISHTRRGL